MSEFETVQYEHPTHGLIEFDAPAGLSDDEIKQQIGGMDLDMLLGVGNMEVGVGETEVEKLKEWENSVGAGKRDGKWFPHESLEGGTDTIAYGHKLTPEEAETGIIKVGDVEYNWKEGLDEDAALAVLGKDVEWAKSRALASLQKVGMEGDEGKVQALTSLIYNVGSGTWAKSKARKFLEAGAIEDFMHEAFSEDVGFVKVNGEKSRGLVRRRAAEASLFAQSNIDEGDSIFSQILDAINPISSAQASERAIPQPKGELGDVNVPMKPDNPLANVTVPKKPSLITIDGKTEVNPTPEGSVLAGVIPSHIRAFVGDILGDTGVKGASYFSTDERNALKGIVARSIERQSGSRGSVSYNDDYLAGSKNVTFKGNNILGDSEDSIQKTLGQFSWEINDEGHVILTDRYNFNDALPKEADAEERLTHVLDSVRAWKDGKVGLYGLIRKGIAPALGSVPGEGSAFVIDLGPKEEVLKSL